MSATIHERSIATDLPPTQSSEAMLVNVYQELRQLAAHYLRGNGSRATLQATALVHEAYLRLRKSESRWANEGHFFVAAGTAIRRIMVEDARQKQAQKRGGQIKIAPLHEFSIGKLSDHEQLVDLSDCLDVLAVHDRLASQVAELRLFCGLTLAQCAEVLGSSVATMHREWIFARAFLVSNLSQSR
ncbi:ECF-type sigma factor [Stieleria sp. ICT_E10.1]|uniref:ECF-type sigma factor n=1 Tax=Stieleria sedimenti TaxID=2976331 RepID=UPI0021802F50|nr:ECF-type sigma factor [Stieleria sedimenti]MCS7466894.1 ECF-type sigma factor [Stieleria sedimenti]